MALDAWPVGLPNYDTRGYSLELQDTLLRTQMDSGLTRVRRSSTFTPTMLTCRWVMSASELRTFRTFYHSNLADGTEAFTMPVFAAAAGAVDGYLDQQVRFAEPYRISYRTADTWAVAARLEVLDDILNV